MVFPRLGKLPQRLLVWVLLSVALLLTSGCSQISPAEAMLADYQQRIEGLTGLEVEVSDATQLLAWPEKRERLLAVPQQRASMADWFRLRSCRLFALINERNSILGRVQQPSQRLIYEVKFIALSRECQEQLGKQLAGADDESALAAVRKKLGSTLAEKERALPAVLWNSTIGSDEFAAMVRLAAKPIAPGNDVEASAAASALDQWLTVQQQALSGTELTASEYEAANKLLAQSQWLGQLYRGQQLAIQTLLSTASALERRLEKPLCFNQQPNRKSQAFRSVFQRYYAGQFQPYLALLKNQQRQAAMLLRPLLEPFDEKPEDVEEWVVYYQVDLQQQFDSALARHTKAWQALLGQCGLMPGTAAYTEPETAIGAGGAASELAPTTP